MVINGDFRVNGNFGMNNDSVINGNRFASGKLTANARLWTLDYYQRPANTSPRARPTNPAGSDDIAWPMGYAPDKTKNINLPEIALPAIGSLSELAGSAAGRITQNNSNLAVNVYSGAGPDGLAGTADDCCLVLDGSADPITINGAVIVPGDVIIRGQVTGQGVIYAGRNIHITGDLVYRNPPAWPKPDADPEATARVNAAKDLLILGAKGNVVIGNFTAAGWSNQVWSIMTADDNIAPYTVSATDAALGYDSDNNPANGYQFDGRLFVNEPNGGQIMSRI